MADKRDTKLATVIRWAARVIALLFTINFFFWNTFFAVGSVVVDLHGEITPVIIVPIAMGIVVLAAEIISWWKERLGGILFILLSAAYLLIHLINGMSGLRFVSTMYMIRGAFTDWAIFGLPLLIAGILFLIAARLSQKNSLTHPPESRINEDSIA